MDRRLRPAKGSPNLGWHAAKRECYPCTRSVPPGAKRPLQVTRAPLLQRVHMPPLPDMMNPGGSRSVLLFALVLLAACLNGSKAAAQDVVCRASRRGAEGLAGTCQEGDSVVGAITLASPSAGAPHLWRGVIRGPRFESAAVHGPIGESDIGLDIRSAVVRLGRSWLSARDVRTDSDEVRFSFRSDRAAPANEIDVSILEKAREMLANQDSWNRRDSTDMDRAPAMGFACAPAPRQSMFCAVYLASLQVSGDYFHFRPAVNAVRWAAGDSSRERYRHPLIEFNNDPTVTLANVQGVLDAALGSVRAERDKCAKACLASIGDQYLNGLVAHGASRLPLAASVHATENGKEVRLGEGLWRTAREPGAYRVNVLDPDSGAVAIQTVLHEGNALVQVLLRLKTAAGQVSEVETLIARRGETCCWAPEQLSALSPEFEHVLSPADRISRDAMIAVVDGYFTALHTSGTPEYQRARGLTTSTNRYENGLLTTNVPRGGKLLGSDAATQFDSAMFGQIRVVNRRYPAVDPENGTVLAIVVFEDPKRERAPEIVSELFKIVRGEIREIRAVMAPTQR